jgi:protein-S-isoprenylcysteine O-methyltransferase Ste14
MPIHTARYPTGLLLFSWAGAAVFAISLLWFLYCYLVRFDAVTADGAVILPLTQNVAWFSIFALHHSVLARTRVKIWVRRLVPPELERSLYTWTASVLFLVVCAWWHPLPGVLYTLPQAWALAGLAVQACGIVLTVRASTALDVLDLAGVRSVLLARSGAQPRHVALKTRGLYRFVRHPLYFGWVLIMFGAPRMTATRFSFAVVSTAYLALAIPWEERSLVEVFGRDYHEYRRRVRWRMIPGLY